MLNFLRISTVVVTSAALAVFAMAGHGGGGGGGGGGGHGGGGGFGGGGGHGGGFGGGHMGGGGFGGGHIGGGHMSGGSFGGGHIGGGSFGGGHISGGHSSGFSGGHISGGHVGGMSSGHNSGMSFGNSGGAFRSSPSTHGGSSMSHQGFSNSPGGGRSGSMGQSLGNHGNQFGSAGNHQGIMSGNPAGHHQNNGLSLGQRHVGSQNGNFASTGNVQRHNSQFSPGSQNGPGHRPGQNNPGALNHQGHNQSQNLTSFHNHQGGNNPGGNWNGQHGGNGNWGNNNGGWNGHHHHGGWHRGFWPIGLWGFSPWWGWGGYGLGYGWGLGLGYGGWGYGGWGYPGYGYGYGGYGYGGYGYSPFGYYSGYYNYYNPYCTGPLVLGSTVIDYSQPIAIPQGTPDTTAPAPDDSDPATVAAMAQFDNARAAFKNGDYAAALNGVQAALQQIPDDGVLHEFRALVLFAQGNYQESAAVINSVLAGGPGWDWETLRELYPDVATYTVQLRALEAFARSHPTEAYPRFLLAYHYLSCGYSDAAVEQLKRVVTLQPNDTVAREMLKSLSPETPLPAPTPATGGGPGLPGTPVPPAAADNTVVPPAPPTAEQHVVAKPVAAESLVGSWNASREDGSKFGLTLDKDGKFSWNFSAKGQTNELKGKYTYANDLLILEPEEGGAMVGRLTSSEDGQFHFQLVGGPPDDPGLTFKK